MIGGSQAAGWVLKTLRAEGFAGRLVMIADEPHLPYERPPLSKAVLAGDADIETVRVVRPDEFDALNVEAWQPERAASIDRTRRVVTTESGREIEYDRLVIATGGTSRRLPDALVRTPNLHYLRTLDEAAALGEKLRASRRVLVIGGGWIGLEVAATARKLGVDAVVVEGAPRLCGRSVPQIVSDFLLDLHRANGVDVRLGAALASLDAQPDDASKVRATLADGTTIDADFAVAGIGLALNASLASDAGWRSTTASSSTILRDQRPGDFRVRRRREPSQRLAEAARAARIVGQRAEPGDRGGEGRARRARPVRGDSVVLVRSVRREPADPR